ncbi:hypothetical protein PtrSN002B_011685 [Pyrenophora tritici-repentis]|uniref:Uncharacterized protein n=1 Tax=Pyrenophora tritici-repentis TaxID=45151 RepID=A0A2W1CVI1_9PLEO|nr:hypothetical protein PtrV1_07085 [Pyrenophora tritici-repentis]KAF7571858.1 hypothetical protein PtrM4_093580 [Pyrenophora tritici-repentis]KAI0569464.1 hypothetical protein Alg215_11622 [Pyrenophora tritici-repentis]KAI0570108.1 hypothetical protein Alg130_11353 [Pyrenophora tritici-repentis]KAI0604433.1 hypothetical protein TUN205_11319 [Pyrenophora tritici-repentis]
MPPGELRKKKGSVDELGYQLTDLRIGNKRDKPMEDLANKLASKWKPKKSHNSQQRDRSDTGDPMKH